MKKKTKYLFTLNYGIYGSTVSKSTYIMNNSHFRICNDAESFLLDIRKPFLDMLEGFLKDTSLSNSIVYMNIITHADFSDLANYKNFYNDSKCNIIDLIKILVSDDEFVKSSFYTEFVEEFKSFKEGK